MFDGGLSGHVSLDVDGRTGHGVRADRDVSAGGSPHRLGLAQRCNVARRCSCRDHHRDGYRSVLPHGEPVRPTDLGRGAVGCGAVPGGNASIVPRSLRPRCRGARHRVRHPVGVEFRDGSPTDLDFVVVTATSLKTAKGIRVGSTRAQVKAAYGTLPFVAGDLGGRYTQGIFDGKGHVLLLIYGDGAGNGDDRVYAMETGLGNTPSTTRMGWWEC